MIRKTILAVVAAALATPALAAQEDFHWTGTVAAGAAVEIKGVNGGIVATGAPGGAVEVTAVKKGRKSDPAGVKVEVVEHAGGVTICAVYPSTGAPNECKPGEGGRMSVRDNDVNVEFRVKVPAGVRFVGRTVNGGIEASGITADAEARTVNGGVALDATGTARAETVNGGITARLGRADWAGALAALAGDDEVGPPGAVEDPGPLVEGARQRHEPVEADEPLRRQPGPGDGILGARGSGGGHRAIVQVGVCPGNPGGDGWQVSSARSRRTLAGRPQHPGGSSDARR